MKHVRFPANLTIIAIFMLVGFGCKYIRSPFAGGAPLSESTAPPEAVRISFKKFMDAPAYHSVVKTKNSTAEIVTEIDFNAPDRYRIINHIPNYKTETIAVGGDSYNRTNDGKWKKMPAGEALPVADMRGKMTDDYLASMKDFEAAGKETIDGRETFIYKFKSTYKGESTSKIWVSANTGLPLKIETEGVYGGTPMKTSTVYDFEKETKIEAPKF